MKIKKSITNRVIIGKTIGFLIGALVLSLSLYLGYTENIQFLVGLWLFYILMGAFTGLFGIYTEHPVLKFKLPFYIRGPLIGIIMHLMLVLLAYEELSLMIANMNCNISPFWALIDGAILGLIMGYIETKYAGEGKKLPIK